MSDEQRRRLEREARYDEKLAALLECMREGHQPNTLNGFDASIALAFQPHPEADSNAAAIVRLCLRCGLAYWEPTRGRLGGAFVVTASRPTRVHVPPPSPRPGYCTCGHREIDHSDLGWRARCLVGTRCGCLRFVQEGTVA